MYRLRRGLIRGTIVSSDRPRVQLLDCVRDYLSVIFIVRRAFIPPRPPTSSILLHQPPPPGFPLASPSRATFPATASCDLLYPCSAKRRLGPANSATQKPHVKRVNNCKQTPYCGESRRVPWRSLDHRWWTRVYGWTLPDAQSLSLSILRRDSGAGSLAHKPLGCHRISARRSRMF